MLEHQYDSTCQSNQNYFRRSMIIVEVILSLSMGNASIKCYLISHIDKCCIFHWSMAGRFTITFYYVTICYSSI